MGTYIHLQGADQKLTNEEVTTLCELTGANPEERTGQMCLEQMFQALSQPSWWRLSSKLKLAIINELLDMDKPVHWA